MSEKQYFRKLRFLLRSLPRGERDRILQFYREILEDKIESGVPEQDAVNELGNVYGLAQKILEENPARKQMSPGKIVAVVLASCFGVLIVAWVTAVALGFVAYTQVKTSGGTASSSVEIAPGHSEPEKSKSDSTDAAGVSAVRIKAENKKIEFVSTDGKQITFKYCPEQDQQYELSNQGGVFSLSNEDLSHGGKFPDFLFNGSVLDPAELITVYIPKDFSGDITVETANSAITASNFEKLGNLSCETSNSAIKMSDVSAQNIKLQSRNAVISLEDVTAAVRLSAQTENAAISLQRIASPDIALKTGNAMVSGTILGREEDYTIDSKTSNAKSNLQSRSGGDKKLSVSTSNAMINLRFEEN